RGELSVPAPLCETLRGQTMSMRPLSRRTFLRGTGAALALPLLDAMSLVRGAGAEEQAPVRMACIYFPNGAWMKGWIPTKTGASFDFPFQLTPLEPYKESVTVLSGLDKANSRSGDGHYAKTANFLTGLQVVQTTGKNLSVGGASIDQLA